MTDRTAGEDPRPAAAAPGAGAPQVQQGGRLQHWSNPAPFDPHSIEAMSPEQERYFMASQWTMMWFKFRRHRLAV